jgi:hypothetical protein
MFARLFSQLLVGSALAVFALGCGGVTSKTVPVEGIVTYEGVPVDGATVVFHSKSTASDAHDATGRTGSDGIFHLTTFNQGDGALPGEYDVSISKKPALIEDEGGGGGGMSVADRARMGAQMMQQQKDKPQAKKAKREELPASYADAKSSGLRAKVPAAERLKFPLTKSGGS